MTSTQPYTLNWRGGEVKNQLPTKEIRLNKGRLFFGDFMFWKIKGTAPAAARKAGKIIIVIAQSMNLLFLRIVVFAAVT